MLYLRKSSECICTANILVQNIVYFISSITWENLIAFRRWFFMLPYIRLFDHDISMYFIAALIGILCAMGVSFLRRRDPRFSISTEDVFYIILCIIMGALIGAKCFQIIGYIINNWKSSYLWTFDSLIHIITNGVGVFYGGLIGGIAAVLLYIQHHNMLFEEVSDLLTPSILIFHVFGRLGCFLVGCCYGIHAEVGVTYWYSLYAPTGITLVPVQLFEAGLNIILLIIIFFMQPDRKYRGILFPLYLTVYSFGRFVLEFLRGDYARKFLYLSIAQWISLLIFPIGIFMLWKIKRGYSVKFQ